MVEKIYRLNKKYYIFYYIYKKLMSENENEINLDSLLNEFANDQINEKSEVLLENMGNMCSTIGYFSKNFNSIEEKKCIKILKLIRTLMTKINNNVYDIIETMSKDGENFSYKDFVNGYEKEYLFPKDNFKPNYN